MAVGSFLVKRGVLFVPRENPLKLKSYKAFYIAIFISSIVPVILIMDGEYFLGIVFSLLLYIGTFIIFFPRDFVNLQSLFINEDGIEYESHSSKFNQYGRLHTDSFFDYDPEINAFNLYWSDINYMKIAKHVIGFRITIYTQNRSYKIITYHWQLAENQENKMLKEGIIVPNEINEENLLLLMLDSIKRFNANIEIKNNYQNIKL